LERLPQGSLLAGGGAGLRSKTKELEWKGGGGSPLRVCALGIWRLKKIFAIHQQKSQTVSDNDRKSKGFNFQISLLVKSWHGWVWHVGRFQEFEKNEKLKWGTEEEVPLLTSININIFGKLITPQLFLYYMEHFSWWIIFLVNVFLDVN
jgi:hypothetical protein